MPRNIIERTILLLTLSSLERTLMVRREARRRARCVRLNRMNEHMLRDIGLARTENEDSAFPRFHPSMLPLQRRDDESFQS
jgi:uncharacterized protein YjiS (DUF1127 family)